MRCVKLFILKISGTVVKKKGSGSFSPTIIYVNYFTGNFTGRMTGNPNQPYPNPKPNSNPKFPMSVR